MRHTLQMKLLIFGLICFFLTVGSSVIQVLQYREIAQNADLVQQRYDVANEDAARLREELIRLIARIKDVWLRGNKTHPIEVDTDLVEQSWQITSALRAKLNADVTLTDTMRDALTQYDASMAGYRSLYVQTLAQYRVELTGPDPGNADTRADARLSGVGLNASNLLGNFQTEVRAATAKVRSDRRASVDTARRVTLAETAVLLAMVAGVGIWLVRSIGRGVGDVAHAAVALGQGARDVRVPVRGKGELAQLATVFNAMVTELGSQERQLEQLRRIAVALTSATTEREACEIVVNGLADTFGYHYVSIYLLRPGDADNLHLICQRGYTTVIDPIPVPSTVTGRAVRERQPILVTDSRLDGDFIAAEVQIVSEACAPILTPDRVLGALLLEEEHVDILTEADLNLITTLANNVSVALENVRLNAEARTRIVSLAQTNRDLAAVMATGTRLAATLDLDAVFHLVTDEIRRSVDAPTLFVATYDEAAAEIAMHVAIRGNTPIAYETTSLTTTLSGWLIRNRQTVRLETRDAVVAFLTENGLTSVVMPPASMFGIPLVVGTRVVGTITIGSPEPHAYSEQQISVVQTIAAQAAIAINNALLYGQVQQQVAEMHRLNEELAVANALKSEFLATMSHELRTPLNAIIGFSELLADEIVTEPEEVQACLTDILNSGRHLLNLINDVLDISKIEAGHMELKRAVFDIREEVQEVARSVAPLLAARGHTLAVAETEPIVPIYADRQRMRQIILNLVSNAIKFTPDGGTITIGVGPDTEDTSLLAVSVRDTGIGIREEDFGKLFEKFRQLDSSHARRYEGTGLGLALTRQLVELNGGAIAVSSTVGAGSVFTFTVPKATAAQRSETSNATVAAVAD